MSAEPFDVLEEVLEDEDAPAESKSRSRGASQATILVQLAAEAELFHTADHEGFARTPIDGHPEVWPLRAGPFRRWLGRAYYAAEGGAPGGQMIRRRLVARTKTDAIGELRALRVECERGAAPRPKKGGATVAQVADEFLAHLESRVGISDERRRYSARTVALYRQRMASHVLPALGSRKVADLTVEDVRRFADRLTAAGLAPSTASGILTNLSALLRFAVKQGHADRNAVRDLDRDDRPGTARQSEPRYLSADELAALLEGVGETFRPVVAACTFAGLRISEALGLRWSDINFACETLSVRGQLAPDGSFIPWTKTRASAATVPMLPALARELRALRSRMASRDLRRTQAGALVFTTSRGLPQSRRNALRALHRAGDALGLNDGREKVSLHDLRHSFVALVLASGGTLAEAALLARHANARVTATVYAGLSDEGRTHASAKLAASGFGA